MVKEKKDRKLEADIYNISRVIAWIACVGIPLRLWYEVATSSFSGGGMLIPLIVSLICAAVLVVLELLVFRKWSRKLDTKAAITQGNMYVRTSESYRSAFDDRGRTNSFGERGLESENHVKAEEKVRR